MSKKNPFEEARRYMENAKKVLLENGKLNPKTRRYEDDKYVRAAGNYLWLGVLKALDAVFPVRKDRRTRVDIKDYDEVIGKRDHKLLDWVNDGYKIMHLSMTYDGIQLKATCDEGFRLAKAIINRCEKMI